MIIATLQMYYPNADFWDGETRDQMMIKMEAVTAREERELIRSVAAMSGLEDSNDALPRWTVDPKLAKLRANTKPFDFSLSAQRGIVEAVERGFIEGDVWAYQVLPIWESLLAASGDLQEWREKELESMKKRRVSRGPNANPSR